jgi:hypothetical protein
MESGIVEAEELSAELLKEFFDDKICVLIIKEYAEPGVCKNLDNFFTYSNRIEQYTHEIRENSTIQLLYYGVDRYGYPLNSTYTDPTGKNLKKYQEEALPTIRSVRKAAQPYMSPIDRLRLELDELWPQDANLATYKGKKAFCGIGRIMPSELSELSEKQPHFDSVPVSYFPDIYKQFAANIYLNVPKMNGELEIWNVEPIEINKVENFKIPDDWRSALPESIKVKPEQGDLLLFNTRRPHAITSFNDSKARTSIQTFIGLTKNSKLFLWV